MDHCHCDHLSEGYESVRYTTVAVNYNYFQL